MAGSTPIPGFAVSTYDARPPNAYDFINSATRQVSNPFTRFALPNPPGTYPGTSNGIITSITTPPGYIFVAREITISTYLIFIDPTPSIVPARWLTNVQGFPSAVGTTPPRISFDINVNNIPSVYQNIVLNNAAYSDYSLPIYLPIEPENVVDIILTCDNAGATLYQPVLYDAQIIIYGNILPDIGMAANDTALNNEPIRVRDA